MDTLTINKLLQNVKGYIGAFPRDLIPTHINKRPISLIVNSHTSDKPGEHWIALILDENGSGEYFDSYGLPPLNGDINSFMEKMCPLGWAYNPVTLQCLSCITCGHYCVLYIKLRNFGYSYCDFISLFSKNLNQNEKIVKKLVPSKYLK
jgi:hypothetical protein